MLVLLDDGILQDIADSIRQKKSTEDKYTPLQMANAIESIEDTPTSVELTNPAAASDILAGKQALNSTFEVMEGNIQTITIPDIYINIADDGTITAEIDYTSGYVATSGNKSNTLKLDVVTIPNINISVGDDGVITASLTYGSGYIPIEGSKTNTQSMSIATINNPSMSANGNVVTATLNYEAGYLPNAGNVSNNYTIPKTTIPNPSITINDDGSISASSNYSAGYVDAGTATASISNAIKHIYIGSDTPSNSTGVDGDIYLQF